VREGADIVIQSLHKTIPLFMKENTYVQELFD